MSFKAIDYEVTRAIFGGNSVKFEHCPEYARYDEELLQTLRDFKKTKRCRSEQALDPSLRVNLCKRNLKRLEICRRLSEADPEGVRMGKINYCVGQPIICNINEKKTYSEEVINTQFFDITSIDAAAETTELYDDGTTITVPFSRFRSG